MIGLRNRQRSWSTRVWAAVWTLMFLCMAAWIVHAARHWKIPVCSAKHYWASRLTGRPQGFLGSDRRWHYFAHRGLFLHGWLLGRTARTDAAQARDEMVRAQIDEWLDDRGQDHTLKRAAELTGLGFSTEDEWRAWWRAHRETYVWPTEQEERWEEEVRSRWGRTDADEEELAARDYYMDEIAGRGRKAAMEILFFAALWLLLWPVWPRVLAAALRSRSGWRRLATAIAVMPGIALITYFVIVMPYFCLDYGLGATTTLSGPGWLIYSGPHPFHFHYKPGNTILYRQFLELVWDPAIRLARTDVLRWAGNAPLELVGLLPYLAGAIVLGGLLGFKPHRPVTTPSATPEPVGPRPIQTSAQEPLTGRIGDHPRASDCALFNAARRLDPPPTVG